MRGWLYYITGICLSAVSGLLFAAGDRRPGNIWHVVSACSCAFGCFLVVYSYLSKPRRRPTVFPPEPKTNCIVCGSQILQTTADRTDGYCMPCFQRAPIEERNVDPWSLPSRRSKCGFDPANRESFLSLCNLIAPEGPALEERVCHSIDDADQFAKFNRKYLGRDTYWLPFDVIVDWMKDHDMLVGLDHNCEFEDIAWAVNKLMQAQGKELQFVVQADLGSGASDQLTIVNEAGKKVRKMGHVLASLNTGDSLELFALPKEIFDQFRTTMNSLNYVQIEVFE